MTSSPMMSIGAWRVLYTIGEDEFQEMFVIAPLDISFAEIIDRGAKALLQNGFIEDGKDIDVSYAEVFLATKEGDNILVFPVSNQC